MTTTIVVDSLLDLLQLQNDVISHQASNVVLIQKETHPPNAHVYVQSRTKGRLTGPTAMIKSQSLRFESMPVALNENALLTRWSTCPNFNTVSATT